MRSLIATFLLAALALPSALPASAQDAPAVPAAAKPHLLERFKALAGEWSGAGLDGNSMPDTNVSYTVTAGGSAVEELLFPGTAHEMRTLYVRDGDDVVLVHFCASGHHPKMRARDTGGDRVVFDFDGAINFDPTKAGHMHDASFTFQGPDELSTRWQFWDGGKPSEHVANLGLRIDLTLVSEALRPQLAAAGIDREPRTWERPSDHAPAWIELAR